MRLCKESTVLYKDKFVEILVRAILISCCSTSTSLSYQTSTWTYRISNNHTYSRSPQTQNSAFSQEYPVLWFKTGEKMQSKLLLLSFLVFACRGNRPCTSIILSMKWLSSNWAGSYTRRPIYSKQWTFHWATRPGLYISSIAYRVKRARPIQLIDRPCKWSRT